MLATVFSGDGVVVAVAQCCNVAAIFFLWAYNKFFTVLQGIVFFFNFQVLVSLFHNTFHQNCLRAFMVTSWKQFWEFCKLISNLKKNYFFFKINPSVFYNKLLWDWQISLRRKRRLITRFTCFEIQKKYWSINRPTEEKKSRNSGFLRRDHRVVGTYP